MKNNVLMYGVVGLLVVLLIGGGAFMFLKNRNATNENSEIEGIEEVELPKIDAKELGLEIKVSADKRFVQFSMKNAKDITRLDWEFSYEADVPKTPDMEVEEGARVTQNLGGSAELEGEESFTSERRELGTCSTGGKCRFDTGITEIELMVKVTKKDGKEYQSETSTGL